MKRDLQLLVHKRIKGMNILERKWVPLEQMWPQFCKEDFVHPPIQPSNVMHTLETKVNTGP